jgi:hypothetical protein
MTGKAQTRRPATKKAGAARGASWGYSPSTQRAKWIESPNDQPDRAGQTLATRNHDVIRRWAEERGAEPASPPGSRHDGRPGVRFASFDERQFVFLHQERTKDGRQSNFFRLDSPQREAA